MLADGVVPLHFPKPEPTSVCHVTIVVTTVIPEQHKVHLQVQVADPETNDREINFTGMMEPEPKFMERYGLLIARSVSINKDGCTIV